MTPEWDAKDKTFLITGGASGLGAEYVKVFLNLGAKSIAILDIAEEVGKAAADSLNRIYKDKVVFIKCDVSKEEDITKAFEEVLSRFQRIDVLINNAGILNDAPNVWRTACAVNWEGVVSLTFKGIKHMRKDEGGHGGTIVNVSSIAALTRFPFFPAYNGSKMAVLHFSQCISMTPFYEHTNVRVLTICFGATDTSLLSHIETRCYELKSGNNLTDILRASGVEYQKLESAVAAFVDMFKNGAPASVWLSVCNRPGKDITSVINRVYKELEALTH